MRLVRQDHQPRRTAVPSNRFVELLRLQRRRAWIRIFPAVDNEQRRLHLVGEEKGGDFQIDILRLPNRAHLILKTERRKSLVIGAAGRRAGLEQIGVGHQVSGHQRPVTVSGDAYAIRVGNPKSHRLIHGCLRIGDELFQISVVGFLRIANDRERSIVDDRVTPKQQQPIFIQPRERLLRTHNLSGL
jgi:hypothetical protein